MAAEAHALDNAVWWSLGSGHRHLAEEVGKARRYRRDVSVFAAVPQLDAESWVDLARLIADSGTCTLFRDEIPEQLPEGWALKLHGRGRQMTVSADTLAAVEPASTRELGDGDVPQMMDLVAETRPGPFLARTIGLGRYIGHFEEGRLLAMAGERLHPDGFTEISAVCTHSDSRGRGLASSLTHQLAVEILDRHEQPFLHVAESNDSARRVYERLGFSQRRLVDLAVVTRVPSPTGT
jgi:ribosomal protein S18 acetylase RimI-like enzyme